ncbi:MAG: hypothetical protein OK455_10660 [Thaumarchaeota archaeon]|nr:hypothetical protein [Nitrososphaerota archaeon]
MGLKIIIQDDDGKVLGMIDATNRGKEKPFSSGSAGYHVNGKASLPSVIDGENKPHQINCSMVEIGTKGKFEPTKKA